MERIERACPDCGSSADSFNRREFLKATGAAAVVAGSTPWWALGAETTATPETVVQELFQSLSADQRKEVCFAWDHTHPQLGLLRTRVANNWHVTQPVINTDFFTDQQRGMIRKIIEGIIQPDWHERIDRQLEDDAGGFGNDQNIAIFGEPGSGKFQFVMTGRHMTLRCDGDSTDHVALGGPIFYGHAASGFNEKPNHPGNVFWNQALAANKVYEMLNGKQRQAALLEQLPHEQAVAFRGASGGFPGLALSEMTGDQRELVQEVLKKLIEPYRQSDRDDVVRCLDAQGGLDRCSLAFYKDGDLGNDQVWDSWRLEGPAFVWYFRGTPHVHVWVNVANDPKVATNA